MNRIWTTAPLPLRSAAILVLTLLVGGCIDLGTDPPDGDAEIFRAEVSDAGPIFRSLEVALSAPAGVEVFYEPMDGGRTFRMESDALIRTHDVLLPRLLADTTYRYAARVIGDAGEPVRGTFTTGSLPSDLQDIDYTVEGEATFPLLLMNHEVESGFSGMIGMEPNGRIVWYATAPGASQAATLVPGSHDMVFISRDQRAVVRLTPRGEIVASTPRNGVADGVVHHDVAVLDEDRVAMIARDERTVGDTTVRGEAVWEWTMSTGGLTKLWSSWDHFDWETDRGPLTEPNDWLHANALSVGPRGNLIMSLHYLNQVISIAPDYQSLEWRLGGINRTVAVSPDHQFTGQHAAWELPGNRVLLFDNNHANAFSGGYSRALELESQGDTAVLAWEYVADPPITAPIWSGVYPLENGNRVVTFSIPDVVRPPEVTDPFVVDEVDPSGQRVWRLTGPGLTVSFRGVPWSSIAGEEPVAAMP